MIKTKLKTFVICKYLCLNTCKLSYLLVFYHIYESIRSLKFAHPITTIEYWPKIIWKNQFNLMNKNEGLMWKLGD